MSTIHMHRTTTSTPEQYIAGLTDFGPGCSKLFGNSADDYLKVHRVGRSDADITEGSGGIWGAWSSYATVRTALGGCWASYSAPSAMAFEGGIRKLRKGCRSPEQRTDRGTRITSRVAANR